ncbi:MAG: RdgB/HAM1 family non-canonical purine NTP pyrophosphatase [Candidatus Omnitrophica bacterium]|nr:RdgB/HAM1 family non-canonical purine NTP pyrophosphatase [Candidatus Omnitrophota bacterium]
MELLVATRNRKKLEEIKEILKSLSLKITSLADYAKAPRIIENGKTFKTNAIKKAVKVARFTGKLTLGEDSGLCVDALGNKPGVYSSRFSGKDKSDAKNNLKVLKLLAGLPLTRRKAHYVCAVALADKGGLIATVEGECSGFIGFELKGSSGFGYDPLFVIPKYKKTFAQLGAQIKHKMSHRYRALKKTKKILQKYVEEHRGSGYN